MADACECGSGLSGSIKWGNFVTSRRRVSFSGRTLLYGGGWLVCRLFVCFVGWLVGWLVPVLMQLNYSFISSRRSSNFRNAECIQ